MSTEFGGNRRPPQARRHWADPAPTAALSTLRWFPGWVQSGNQAPSDLPARKRVVLRDGSRVLIRQVRPTDAALLADGFARLSARSRRMRFLANKPRLSQTELRYLANVDHHDHEALGALSLADERGVGVARYIRDAHDPELAEIAVTVVDEWQGRGLGTELLARLADRARAEGVQRFSALVAAYNEPMVKLLHNMGALQVHDGFGTVAYEIALGPAGVAAATQPLGSADDLLGPGARALSGSAGCRGHGPANVA
jgi:RimJ/RimL family protein N-acetyltransferase